MVQQSLQPEKAPVSLSMGPAQAPTQKLSFRERIGNIADRLKNAYNNAKNGKSLKEKIFLFLGGLTQDVKKLQVAEKQVDQQEASKVAGVIQNASPDQLTAAIKPEIAGANPESLPADEKAAVDALVPVIGNAFQNDLNDQERTAVATSLGFAGPEKAGKALADSRNKLLVAFFGLKTLKGFKLHFQRNRMGVDAIAGQIDAFKRAIMKGNFKPGSSGTKDLFKFDFVDLATLASKLPLKTVPTLAAIKDPNWSADARAKVIGVFGQFLPATASNTPALEKAVDTIHDVASKGRGLESKDIATLLYHVEANDFDHLAEIIHS